MTSQLLVLLICCYFNLYTELSHENIFVPFFFAKTSRIERRKGVVFLSSVKIMMKKKNVSNFNQINSFDATLKNALYIFLL
jgi:hypothetical protein